MKQKKAGYRLGVGASSIMMIFVVLILTTLGVLSFASARSDLTLTERRTAQVQAYYEANAEAQALLAEIDAALLAAQADPDEYAWENVLWDLPDIDHRIEIDDDMVVLRIPVGEAQELTVGLTPTAADATTRYTITQWYLINIEEWSAEEFITLTY